MNYMMKYNVSYQAAKADLSSSAQENIGNIRTLKAFADEKGAVEKYQVLNHKTYIEGWKKARVYGAFFFSYTCLQNSAFAAMLYILSITYVDEGLTIG